MRHDATMLCWTQRRVQHKARCLKGWSKHHSEIQFWASVYLNVQGEKFVFKIHRQLISLACFASCRNPDFQPLSGILRPNRKEFQKTQNISVIPFFPRQNQFDSFPCIMLALLKWKNLSNWNLQNCWHLLMTLAAYTHRLHSPCYSLLFLSSFLGILLSLVWVFSIFIWFNNLTLVAVKCIKWSWMEVERGRGHSLLTECAVCMNVAEWLKFLF